MLWLIRTTFFPQQECYKHVMFIHSLSEPDDINKQTNKKLTRMLFVVILKESMISGKDHTPKGITKKVRE